MLIFLLKKLGKCFLLMIGVSILSFVLIAFSGKDAAEILTRANSLNATDEMIENTRTELGLNKSMPEQYIDWMKGFVTGDLGVSIQTMNSVSKDITGLFPKTLKLVGLSLLWTVALTIPLAILCVRFRGKMFDQIMRIISIFGICIPTFWLGFVFLIVFAVNLKITTVVPKPGLGSLILPSLALAIPTIFSLLRQLRATLLDELSKDYIKYAKERGLSNGRILIKHALKNAIAPIVTMLCQYLGYMVAGSVVVESVFSIKGIGSYMVGGVNNGDSRAVASCITIIAAIFVFSNLVGELSNRALIPWTAREQND